MAELSPIDTRRMLELVEAQRADGLIRNPEVTVCVACRNEEANAEAIAAAIIENMESVDADFDIIFDLLLMT